jgi:hypothetical protein
MTLPIPRLMERYAEAKRKRSGVGEAYGELRAARHNALTHEICMRKARVDLEAATKRVEGDCKTLRETLGFGEAQR